MRLILSPQDASLGAGSGCVEDAHAAGFRVYISLQFNNHWTPSQVAAYVARVLPAYAPFVWAVGVGNEQDLSMASAYGQGTVSLSRDGRSVGQNYRVVWNAVEPVLMKLVPRAIRVYGEFSPWGFSATEQGFAHRAAAGVQAIAAHCYHTKVGGLLQVPQEAAWAASEAAASVVLGDGARLAPPLDAQVDRDRLVGVVGRGGRQGRREEPRSPDVGLLLRPRAVGAGGIRAAK